MKKWLMLMLIVFVLPMTEGATGPVRRVKRQPEPLPKNYVVIYYNRQYTAYYCIGIGAGEHLFSSADFGIQITIKTEYLKKILVYPKNVGQIQSRP